VPGEPFDFAGRGDADLIASLMEYGGFPEPFLSQSSRTLRRWQKERLDRFFLEDVRELETIRNLASMQEMADLLPERVGSPLSLNVLRENLEVSHRAVTLWINALERLYHVVRVPPWSSARVRSLRKMPKAYLWDWSLVPDRAGHEVDFLVTHRRRPWIAVEVKLSESRLAPELLYFRERLRIPSCYQVVLEGDRDFLKDGVRCLPAARFLAGLV
jgi:predicted AAA+ superfamily ATPase